MSTGLDKQVVGVNLTRGLDTRNDSRLVLPGRLLELTNASVTKKGTIRRRDGYASIASVSALQGLLTRADELLALGGNALYSYSKSDSALLSRGGATFATIGHRPVVHNTTVQYYPDAATNGSYTCYVWTEYTAASVFSATKYLLLDESTGTIIAGPTSIDTNNNGPPRVVSITGAFLIFYGGGANNLTCRVIQTSAPTSIGAATNLVTDYNHGALDAIGVSDTGYVYYVSSVASANSSKAFSVTQTAGTPSVAAGPVAVTTDANASRATMVGVSIASFGGGKLGVYALVTAFGPNGAGMWGGVLNTNMTVSAASALKDATAAPTTGGWGGITAVLNGTTMYVYSDDAGRSGAAANVSPIRRTGLDSTNAIVSAAATWANSAVRANGTNGPFIAAKAFLVGSTVYVPMYVREEGTGTLQNTWFLYNDSAAVVASALNAKWGPRTAANASATLPTAIGLSSTKFGIPTGEVGLLSIASGTTISPTGLSRLDVSFPANGPVSAELGGQTFAASAMPIAYDGAAPCEANFCLFPEVISVADAGAGNIPDGTYGYVALYEWYDNAGQRHQSAPSPGVSFQVTGGPKNNTVTIPSLFVTRRTGINIAVYRTKKDGTEYFRANAITNPVNNSSSAATVTYTDDRTDAQLGEPLYTTGDILPNTAVPPCSMLMKHQGRLWIDQGDDSGAFQFSQPQVEGFGLQWNGNLGGRIDEPLTGFASMDGKAILFSAEHIWVVFGNGPGTTGIGGSYSLPERLAADVGCSEARSILLTPDGIIFKSSKGWHLLGRDLNTRYIGAGAEAYNSQNVTRAVLLADQKECRFMTSTSSGSTLVYSYLYPDEQGVGQWGTYDNQVSTDALWWSPQSAFMRCTSAGALVQELPATSSTSYGDGATTVTGFAPTAVANLVPYTGSPIPLTFRTGWLKPGEALQAFQRIWRVLLTGLSAGYAGNTATLVTGNMSETTLTVDSTSRFTTTSGSNTLVVGWGSVGYFLGDAWSVASDTTISYPAGLPATFSAGAVVCLRQGLRSSMSAGTLDVYFYFDGDDSTPFQHITITDVAPLVSGNAWNVRLQPNLQKCDAIMMKVVQTPSAVDPGASLEFSGMTMELGVKKGARKYPAAQTK